MLNPSDYKPENSNLQELITDSSDFDSDWENSTDTLYLNYDDSSAQSSDSDVDDEIVIKVPKLSRFFVGQ